MIEIKALLCSQNNCTENTVGKFKTIVKIDSSEQI